MGKKKNFLLFALKFIVSFALIAYILIYRTSIKDILEAISGANLFWIVISFSLHALGLLISAYRWQILIRAQGDSVPLGFLAKSYLVSSFFNNFLPTRIGGDVVRIWDGSRYSRSLAGEIFSRDRGRAAHRNHCSACLCPRRFSDPARNGSENSGYLDFFALGNSRFASHRYVLHAGIEEGARKNP